MLIILRHQSYSTSTHTNCLIQFVKERFDQAFVSTEAAHSTAAFQSVKLFLKNFSFLLNRLAEPKQGLRSAGGAYYSIRKHCQAPHSSTAPQPCRPGAFYRIAPLLQAFYLPKPLIKKTFYGSLALQERRIIGSSARRSSFISKHPSSDSRTSQQPVYAISTATHPPRHMPTIHPSLPSLPRAYAAIPKVGSDISCDAGGASSSPSNAG